VEIIKKEHHPFERIEEEERGFRLLKQKIIENLVLALPYF